MIVDAQKWNFYLRIMIIFKVLSTNYQIAFEGIYNTVLLYLMFLPVMYLSIF